MSVPGPAAFGPCPCGSGAAFGACCRPLLDGTPAETAEALMRSRYSAYAVGDLDYVVRTWHPRTRPAGLSTGHSADRSAGSSDGRGPTWLGLEVLDTVDGGPADRTGEVEFRARYRTPDGEHVMRERSRFERRGGRWVYVDGDVT